MPEGGYPPAGHFLGDLGLETEVLSPGRAVVRMRATPETTGGDGGVRAGVLATLVDVVGGVAALRMIGPDWLATADLTLQVARPLTGPVVEARGEVVRRGHTTLVLEAGVYDCDEEAGGPTPPTRADAPSAWASMTFAILPGRSPTSTVDVPAELPDRWRTEGRGFDRPIVEALSISVVDPAAGVVSMPVSEYLHNSFGAVQGGVMAILGEVAGAAALGAGAAALSADTGSEPVVRDLRVTYLALGRAGPMVSRTSVLEGVGSANGGSAVVELVDSGQEDRLTTVVQVGSAADPAPAGRAHAQPAAAHP